MPKDQKRNFDILIDYLGLSDKFNLRGSRVSLQKNGKVAGHDSISYDSYILGENVYQLGAMRFKLRLVFFEDRHWIMVGVVKANFVPKNHYFDPYDWNGAYGFAVGRRTHFMIDGEFKNIGSQKSLWEQGDTVEFVLDCDGGKLSLHLPTGQQKHIVIPKRLFVNLHERNDNLGTHCWSCTRLIQEILYFFCHVRSKSSRYVCFTGYFKMSVMEKFIMA